MCARKTKKIKPKTKRKTKTTAVQSAQAALKERLRRGPLGDKARLVQVTGAVKMSEVLTEFVRPYLDRAETDEQTRKLFGVAVLAWNTALLPPREREAFVNRIVTEAIPDDRQAQSDIRVIIRDFIRRKEQYFAEINRYIVDYELTDLGDDFHLSVIALIEPPPGKQKPWADSPEM